MNKWFNWISPRERRNEPRQARPHLLAYYWEGGTPEPHEIKDVSSNGFYLLTPERWYPGTLVMVSLQRIGATENDADRSITVQAKVVRLGDDGVALELVTPMESPLNGPYRGTVNGADRKTVRRFLQRLSAN
jgi:hypothetical protein